MMKKYKGNYVLACSAGPDSMALLAMSAYLKMNIIVAMVNYHTRKESDAEMQMVIEFCKKYHIPYDVHHAYYNQQGNFEQWARDVRYTFFKNLCDQYQCDGILVGHHLDDLLETYLLQRKRKIIPSVYGLKECVYHGRYKVIRPLLSYTKQELLDFVIKNEIPYSLDVSNQSDTYLRNKIRNQILKRMSYEGKMHLLKEIQQANVDLEAMHKEVHCFLSQRDKYAIHEFKEFPYQELCLRSLLKVTKSSAYYQELIKQILQCPRLCLEFDDFYLMVHQGYFYISSKEEFSYQIKELKEMDLKSFKLRFKGPKNCGVMVVKEDFPLTIRTPLPSDKIELSFGHKKVSRLFIDAKIPMDKRKKWPIVLNCKNEILLVPKIACKKTHSSNNMNLFVLEL